MASVELWNARGREHTVELDEPVYRIGSDPEAAHITITDSTVSAVHAMLERVGSRWLVRDLGSRNGTWINGVLLDGQRQLRHSDELRLGTTHLIFRDSEDVGRKVTDTLQGPPPDLTRTEKKVLVELCRPLLLHNPFQEPASVVEIAARLYIGRNAVQAHLVNLYDKFGIHSGTVNNRRVALANESIRRGGISRGDLDTGDDHD